jgi:hypothetical protein
MPVAYTLLCSLQGSNEPLVVKFADTKKQKEKKMQMKQQFTMPPPLPHLSGVWSASPVPSYPEVRTCAPPPAAVF